MSETSGKFLALGGADDPAVKAVVARALELVSDGARIGLGSGRASHAFIKALGARVQQGLRVQGVPTSVSSEHLALELSIPLIDLTEDIELDLTIDGADEVAPNLDLVKGWGGALVRERVVASASKRQIILVGPEKLVQTLGERGRIPVEVIPLAVGLVTRKLKKLGLAPKIRQKDGRDVVTDNGNVILDCAPLKVISDGRAARELEARILEMAGVVDTGLFLGTAERVLIGNKDGSVDERVVKS
ncbi:MAG TPA: ribose-5-phosphate isomerase RpiA [Planctomycetota bacterium]|nr:ribose-5-phosphate isomerase RpiA [Planctomycetota bacterium]